MTGATATGDHRPPTDYGEAGMISTFRGPYHDGPPPEALEVVTPPLGRFGFSELRRWPPSTSWWATPSS